MPYVFLAYNRDDRRIMEPLRDYLRARDIDVWTDEHIPEGAPNYHARIEEAIRKSNGLIVLISPEVCSPTSYVRNEIGYAQTHGKEIYPIMVRGNEAPIELNIYQWAADIRGRKQKTTDEAYHQLAQRLAAELGVKLKEPSAQQINVTVKGNVKGNLNVAGGDIVTKFFGSTEGKWITAIGVLASIVTILGFTFADGISVLTQGQVPTVITPSEVVDSVENLPTEPEPTPTVEESQAQIPPTDTPTSSPAPTTTPTPEFECDGALPSRLSIGDRAIYNDGDTGYRLAIREQPGREYEALIIFNANQFPEVIILDGPVCNNEPGQGNYIWWQVNVVDENIVGWAAESTTLSYFLTPK